jgi:WD40 repeat protein
MKVKHNFAKAHGSSLYCVRPIGEHLCATGDEDGIVRLWDFRQPKFVMEAKKFDEFVSDFVVDDELKTLVASSGEGENVLKTEPDESH